MTNLTSFPNPLRNFGLITGPVDVRAIADSAPTRAILALVAEVNRFDVAIIGGSNLLAPTGSENPTARDESIRSAFAKLLRQDTVDAGTAHGRALTTRLESGEPVAARVLNGTSRTNRELARWVQSNITPLVTAAGEAGLRQVNQPYYSAVSQISSQIAHNLGDIRMQVFVQRAIVLASIAEIAGPDFSPFDPIDVAVLAAARNGDATKAAHSFDHLLGSGEVLLPGALVTKPDEDVTALQAAKAFGYIACQAADEAWNLILSAGIGSDFDGNWVNGALTFLGPQPEGLAAGRH